MKSSGSFLRRAGWPRRPFRFAYAAAHSIDQRTQSFDTLSGLSTRDSTTVTGKLRRVERLGRADVANGLLAGIVDHAPESPLRAHLSILGVPRVSAVRRFAGEGADIFAAQKERDGARRRNVEAELLSGFAEVQFRKALSLTLGILFGPEDTEISVRHLVGSLL